MVCLGNICRSPVAEGVMRDLIIKHQLDAEVDSAGTANYHVGEAPDKRTIANAKKHNCDLTQLRARHFKSHDFDLFDVIYVMDESNYNNVINLAKNENHKKKVKYLLDEVYPNQKRKVPDPYYGTEKDFEEVFCLVEEACTKIAEQLKTKP